MSASLNVILNFHQLEPTPAIKDVLTRKSAKLQKFFLGPAELSWTMSAGKEGHQSHAKLSGDGSTFNASSTRDDLYKTFDDVIGKLERQLVKKKSISKNHIHRKHGNSELLAEEETNELSGEF